MADPTQMPDGVNPRSPGIEEYLKRIDAFSEKLVKVSEGVIEERGKDTIQDSSKEIRESLEKFNDLQESFVHEFKVLQRSGASRKELKMFVEEQTKIIENQKQLSEDTIKQNVSSLDRLFKDVQYTDSKQALEIESLLKMMHGNTEDLGGDMKKDRDRSQNLFSKMLDKIDLSKPAEEISQALLGPMRLLTEPLGEMFGLRGPMDIFNKIGGFFTGMKEKVTPKRNEMLKRGVEGASAVYLADTLLKGLKGDDEGLDLEGGFLQRLLGGDLASMGGGIFNAISKAAPFAAIAGGLIWGVIDGFKAMAQAENWGVSKVAAAIGGFLAGSGEGGFMDAFKNMGKWALIGAGVGSIVPGIGTIAGGLVGAAIGGILGFIGGERISKAIQAIGDFFSKAWTGVVDFFKGIMNWDNEDSLLKNLTRGYINLITFIPRMIIGWVGGVFSGIGNFFSNIFGGGKETSDSKKVEKGLFKSIGGIVIGLGSDLFGFISQIAQNAWSGLTGFISSLPSKMMEAFGNIGTFMRETVWPGLTGFFGGFFERLGGHLSGPLDFVRDKLGSFFEAVFGFFDGIIDFFKNFSIGGVIEAAGGLVSGAAGRAGEAISGTAGAIKEVGANVFDSFMNFVRGDSVRDAIIKSDGTIIHTDPSDHIIATKNEPNKIFPDSLTATLNNNRFSPSATVDRNFSTIDQSVLEGDAVIDNSYSVNNSTLEFDTSSLENLLETLITVMQEKNFSNVIQNNMGKTFDFDSFRLSGAN